MGECPAALEMCKNLLQLTVLVFLLLFFPGELVRAQPFGPHSEAVGVSAVVGEEVTVTPGGGSFGFVGTGVRFSGEAYPLASVTLLKEGQEMVSVKADASGKFYITLPEDYSASILYSLIAEDLLGERSLLINYPLVIRSGFLTHLSGVRFPPTVTTDKMEVKYGNFLSVSGYAMPNRDLDVVVEGAVRQTFSLTSPASGRYKIVLPMSSMPKGEYVLSVGYPGDARVSKLVKFTIGELDIFHPESLQNIPGDCNSDLVIDLVDFSVLAFWYGKNNPPSCVDTNRDGAINLIDFSILAFYWTG